MMIVIPLRTVSANVREHWGQRSRRVAAERRLVWAYLPYAERPKPPAVVTFTRMGPRALDDDNLRFSCKAARDQIACWLGVEDNDPRVIWHYAQESARDYAVKIEVTEAR